MQQQADREAASAKTLQRFFKTHKTTAALCKQWLEKSEFADIHQETQPNISYYIFFYSLAELKDEYGNLFERLSYYLHRFHDQCFSFHNWYTAYCLVMYRRYLGDLYTPNMHSLELYSAHVLKAVMELMMVFSKVKQWKNIPMDLRTDVADCTKVFHILVCDQILFFEHMCSDDLYPDTAEVKYQLRELQKKSDEKKECTCRLIEDWHDEYVEKECFFLQFPEDKKSKKECFFPALQPSKFECMKHFPKLWKHFPVTRHIQTANQTFMPPVWKRRLFSTTQWLFEACLEYLYKQHQAADPNKSYFKTEYVEMVQLRILQVIFPEKTSPDEEDMKIFFKCLMFPDYRPPTRCKFLYAKFFETFINDCALHIKFVCEHEKMTNHDISSVFCHEMSCIESIMAWVLQIKAYLTDHTKIFRCCVESITEYFEWEDKIEAFSELQSMPDKNEEVVDEQIDIVVKMCKELYDALVFLRIKSFHAFFCGQMYQATNWCQVGTVAMRDMVSRAHFIHDNCPLSKTKNFLTRVVMTHIQRVNCQSIKHMFALCLVELCTGIYTSAFPELFYLEWPRIHTLYNSLDKLTSFAVVHVSMQMLGMDPKISVAMYESESRQTFLHVNRKTDTFIQLWRLQKFMDRDASKLLSRVMETTLNAKKSKLYDMVWKRVLAMIFSTDASVFQAAPSSFAHLDPLVYKQRIIMNSCKKFKMDAKFMRDFQHMKAEIYTFRAIFQALLETSWKVHECRFTALFTDLIQNL